MRAVEDYCGLYRVPCFRMQSRAFTVVGGGGRERPMFVGEWTDETGVKHKGGMPDFLLTPYTTFLGGIHATIALWVECKAGSGKLSPKQKRFREYIEITGGHYLLIENNPEALVTWFEKFGVVRP